MSVGTMHELSDGLQKFHDSVFSIDSRLATGFFKYCRLVDRCFSMKRLPKAARGDSAIARACSMLQGRIRARSHGRGGPRHRPTTEEAGVGSSGGDIADKELETVSRIGEGFFQSRNHELGEVVRSADSTKDIMTAMFFQAR